MPRIVSLAGIALAALLPPLAAAADDVEAGRAEFIESCAVCHGIEARGNGPLAMLLNTAPADLTGLSAANGGEFPTERVYRVIDGRTPVEGHGTGDMPVWGREYSREAIERYGQRYGAHDSERFVTARILSLISYLREIQTD